MKKIKFQNILIISLVYIFCISNAYSQSGWVRQTIGTRNYVAVKFINSDTGYLIGSDGAILKTTNQGLNWTVNSTSVFNSPVLNGFIIDENTFAVIAGGISYGMIYTSSDGGNNWVSGMNDIRPVSNGYIWLKGLNFLNSVTGYVCGTDYGSINGQVYADGIVYKTSNSGINWFQSHRGGFVYYDVKFKDSLVGYTNASSIIKTTDGGELWEYHGSVGYNTFSLSNIFNDTMYSSGDSGKVYRSISGGLDWIKFYTPANDTLRQIYFNESKTGYAIGNGGAIVKTTNAGLNWVLQTSSTTRNLNSIWFINKDTGFVVGDNGTILKTISGGLLVNVNSNYVSIPDNYFLSQNYPNPFNPVTNLEFGIAKWGFVSMKVFDVLGNDVVTLVNENKPAGSYQIQFNGSNLPSGVYYYKIKAGNFEMVRKMVLIK